jgi:glycosyltransferase involved in cell wall biosynthesis
VAGVLVHEWIAQSGGSENVLEEMSRLFPNSDIVCLWNDSTRRFTPSRLHETWLARSPLRHSKALALPLMPATWRGLKNRHYDWALISSHLFAHHARFVGQPADFRRYVYIHTPARYIWNPELDVRGSSAPVRAMAAMLKPLDRRRAQEPAQHAANSTFVQERIAKSWGVESRVIHPPVRVEQIQAVTSWEDQLDPIEAATFAALPTGFVLGASRFIPYKRLDLVIRAGELSDLPVVLAGDGPELPRLRELAARASVPVHFVIAPSSALLYALYSAALVYVFPAIEDFGIMPVEAMAAGAPVLGQSVGGTAETILHGTTGALVTFDSESEIADAIAVAAATKRTDRLEHAKRYSTSRFAEQINRWIAE